MTRAFIAVQKFAASILAIGFGFHLSVGSANEIVTFSSTGRFELLMTGNTLGLSGAEDANGPGTEGSIHTFTALSTGLIDDEPPNPTNPWPTSTTFDFRYNGSAGNLNIPDDAKVEYAELIWGGSYRYVEDVETELNSNVRFSTPAYTDQEVAPSSQTMRTLDFLSAEGFQVSFYVRSAVVTELVAQSGSGVYAVSGVPGTQHELNNDLNAAGWALIVVVSHPEFQCRDTQMKIVGDWVDEANSTEVLFSGLKPKDVLPLGGKLLVGAIEGDAELLGDGLAIKSPEGPDYIPLTTPNNPLDNFFSSQINDISGSIDVSGTWGSVNHDAHAAINNPGARQGWDITGVQLDSDLDQLQPDQEQVSFRASTTGDAFLLSFLALEIDADPNNSSCISGCIYNVSAPGDGENWISGDSNTISWSSTGVECSGTVDIELYQSGDYVQTIATDQSGPDFSWAIPADHPIGYGYTVKIIDSVVPDYGAESNGSFIINDPYCNVNIMPSVTEPDKEYYEACDVLIIPPGVSVDNGTLLRFSAGKDVVIERDFKVADYSEISVDVCGQSLCEISTEPMPSSCHSCVEQICGIDPYCCNTQFDRSCLNQVSDVCGLVCE